jgi:hypothetical protein
MMPDEIRRQLLQQHEQLKSFFGTAAALGERLLAGDPVEDELSLALAMLNAVFADHNTLELAALGPLLSAVETRGPALVKRLLDEHREEHAYFHQALNGDIRAVAVRLPELAEMMIAHMMAEERTFLSLSVWRPSVGAAPG